MIKQESENKDLLVKIKRCQWCGRKKMLTIYHQNEYFKGWFCSECILQSDEASEAVEKDKT